MNQRALVLSLVVAACASQPVRQSKPVIGPADETAWAIECERSPDECNAEAKRRCPKGFRTLEPGKQGYYADDEDLDHVAAVPKERHNFKWVGWVVACD